MLNNKEKIVLERRLVRDIDTLTSLMKRVRLIKNKEFIEEQ